MSEPAVTEPATCTSEQVVGGRYLWRCRLKPGHDTRSVVGSYGYIERSAHVYCVVRELKGDPDA